MKNAILSFIVVCNIMCCQNIAAQTIEDDVYFNRKTLLGSMPKKVEKANESKIENTQVQHFNTFTQKGTKLFVKCECWDDNQFNQDFLTELGGKGIWKIVNNANEADFILYVNAWFRPQVEGIVYEAYALVYDNAEHLLYKSDIYLGQPTAFNGYDPRKASVKNLINEGLLKEIPKSKWIYSEPLDLLGYSKITEDKYKAAENYFRQGIDYFNQYNYKEAIKTFTMALSINPENAYTYEYMAIAFFNLSKYGDARKNIIAAMKLDPINRQNDTTYYNIMVGKNSKFMNTWGSGGTMDRINGAINTVSGSINSLNNVNTQKTSLPQNTTITNTTQQSNKTNGHIERVTCPSCNGRKVQESPSYGASFGLDRSSNTRCPVCGKYENHYHANCIPCQGKGYIEKYVP